MTITSVTGNNGAWSVNPDKTLKFIPTTGFYGLTTASYTVCDNTTPVNSCATSTIKVNITSANSPPLAVDDAYTIYEDSIQLLTVLLNDVPGSGGINIAGIPVKPKNGKVSINVDNTITYLPNADYNGLDSFYYKISSNGGYFSTAKVLIAIKHDCCTPGNYKKILGPIITTTQNILASDDSYLKLKSANSNFGTDPTILLDRETTDKHVGVIKFDLSNLICYATLVRSATMKMEMVSGNVQLVSAYRLLNNWQETQVTWNNRLTATPWATAGGDYNPADLIDETNSPVSNIYSWNMNTVMQNMVCNSTLYPNYGFQIRVNCNGCGNRSTTFASRENTTSGVLKPTMQVTFDSAAFICSPIPVRPPLAMPDTAATTSNSSVLINVIANDQLPGANPGTISILSGSFTSGSAVMSGNNITYQPTLTFQGNASFQYVVTDNITGLKDTAKVFVYVSYPPPIANNDSLTIQSGSNGSMNILANDIDLVGLGLTNSIVSAPHAGSMTQSGTTITYTAPFNFYGRDTITYRIANTTLGSCNESNAADTAYFIITVLNRPPVAVNDAASTNPCQPISINVLDNDSDPENGSITIATVSAPAPADAGTATTDGSLIYFTPNPAFAGPSASLTYTIADDAIPPAVSNSASITINFNNAVNLPPVAINDTAYGLMNEDTYVNLLDNDTDPENDPLTISLQPSLLQPAHGTILLQANGLLKYTPNTGFTGIDEFEYKLADSHFGPNGGSCSSFSQSTVARVRIIISNLFFVLSNNNLQLSGTGNGLRNVLKWSAQPAGFPATCLLQKSTDNRTFNTLTAVHLYNSADAGQLFEWTDYQLQDPAAFYRVNLVSPGYPADYSNTVFIKSAEAKSILQTYPVPFSNQLNARIFTSSVEKMDISLFNAIGLLVKKQSIIPQKGLNTLQFDQLQQLSSGVYIFSVTQNGVTTRQKISKR
jgi:hypothetical protein